MNDGKERETVKDETEPVNRPLSRELDLDSGRDKSEINVSSRSVIHDQRSRCLLRLPRRSRRQRRLHRHRRRPLRRTLHLIRPHTVRLVFVMWVYFYITHVFLELFETLVVPSQCRLMCVCCTSIMQFMPLAILIGLKTSPLLG